MFEMSVLLQKYFQLHFLHTISSYFNLAARNVGTMIENNFQLLKKND